MSRETDPDTGADAAGRDAPAPTVDEIVADGGYVEDLLYTPSDSASAPRPGSDANTETGAGTGTADRGRPRPDGGEDADPETVVVKVGGARAVDPEGAVADVAHLAANGVRVVVVHGGSTAVDETLEAMGKEPTYVETPGGVAGRFTDEETMEAFEMVMPGKLNTDLTAQLREAGVDAIGLSGVDGGLLTGPRKSAVRVIEGGKKKIKRGDHSGRIEEVNAGLLETLLANRYVPVVTVPMLADDGVPVNADADRAAAAVAGALGATLVVLTDVAGVYADPDDPETLIESATTPAAFERVEAAAEGFMAKKVLATEEALTGGAEAVIVSDANRRDPITGALNGAGTRVERSAVTDESETESGDGDETETGTETETEGEHA